MQHLPELIQDLGLILMAAAVMTLLFRAVKQPVVLGYLVAGFLVGPHFTYLPAVQDHQNIETWSQIGVIFMLFGLGLEFSFKKLVHTGKTAVITAAVEIIVMIIIGYLVGQIMHWDMMNSLFLGAILSMSSTTIIVKAFDEQHLKGRSFAPVVFGVLVVEDLIAILLLVFLASIAVTKNVSGSELLYSSSQLIFFLILWFLLGIYILPAFFRRCRKLFTDEILLIVAAALCFMMVIVAVKVGFSAALGAFVMGSLLSETSRGTKIEHLMLPVKDLFAAVFFVSVGMMIDPLVLYKYGGFIVLIVFVTIFGKFFGTAFGALLSGCNVKNSMQAGMSMAQIGEFSFIIAALGHSLHVTEDFLYPIAVAVSAVTTFTTPYLIKSSETVTNWLNARIPERIQLLLLRYEVAMTLTEHRSALGMLLRVHGIRISLNAVIIIALAIAVRYATDTFITAETHLQQKIWIETGGCFLTLLVSAPFLWMVFYHRRPRSGNYNTETIAILQRFNVIVTVIRVFIGSILIGFAVGQFIPVYAISGLLLIFMSALLIFLMSEHFEPLYHKIEERFVAHLSDKEREAIRQKTKRTGLAPWDVSLTEFVVSQHSPLVAKTLQESDLRQRYGVTAAMIERGGTLLMPPGRNDLLLPFDKIYLIGTDEELTAVRHVLEDEPEYDSEFDEDNIGLMSWTLPSGHGFAGKRIRECGIRDLVNGLIVGIEREGYRYLNPQADMVLHADDLLWLVGDKARINKLKKGSAS